MDKSKKISSGLELPPLRSLNEFILESARFQIPNFKDLEKWNNRVVNNLLYYQTNYFFMFVVIFLSVGFFHFGQMLIGCLATSAALAVFAFFSAEGRAIHNFRKQHPVAGMAIAVLGALFIFYSLSSMLIFFIGILLPICVMFAHASLRLRNLKNKVVNTIEGIGLKRTPMGVFLEYFGMEPDLFD